MEDSEGGPPQALLGAQGSSGSSLLQACWGIGGSIQTAEELGWMVEREYRPWTKDWAWGGQRGV